MPVFTVCFLILKKHFLRETPALKHYSDIVSDIPPGSVYGMFFSAILSDMLSGIYSDILSIWYIFGDSLWLNSGRNTLIRSSRLTYGGENGREHSDPELAVEVRRGTL